MVAVRLRSPANRASTATMRPGTAAVNATMVAILAVAAVWNDVHAVVAERLRSPASLASAETNRPGRAATNATMELIRPAAAVWKEFQPVVAERLRSPARRAKPATNRPGRAATKRHDRSDPSGGSGLERGPRGRGRPTQVTGEPGQRGDDARGQRGGERHNLAQGDLRDGLDAAPSGGDRRLDAFEAVEKNCPSACTPVCNCCHACCSDGTIVPVNQVETDWAAACTAIHAAVTMCGTSRSSSTAAPGRRRAPRPRRWSGRSGRSEARPRQPMRG